MRAGIRQKRSISSNPGVGFQPLVLDCLPQIKPSKGRDHRLAPLIALHSSERSMHAIRGRRMPEKASPVGRTVLWVVMSICCVLASAVLLR